MDKPKIFFRIYPGNNDEPTRRRRGFFVANELLRRGWDVRTSSPEGCDIAVLQRLATPADVREHQAAGRLVCLETNDCLILKGTIFHVPTEIETVATVDYVIAATRWMQSLYARVNPRCLVMPEILEDSLWVSQTAALPDEPLVLSWHGMHDNLPYIEPIIEELKDVRDLRLRIVTSECDSKGRSNRERVAGWPIPTDFVVWQLDTFAHEIAQAHCGLVFLPDTAFCRAKGSHKVLAYGCGAIPSIASNVPGYREVITHGENGLLAETPEQWREAIEFIRDPGERQNLGANARAMSEYCTREHIGTVWDRLLTKIWQVRGSEAA